MRLVLINRFFQPDESATSQLLTDLAHALAARYPVVVLCTRQRLEDAAAALPRRERLGRVEVRRLWTTHWGRRWLPGRLLDYVSFLASVACWLALHVRTGDLVIAKTDPPLLGVVASAVGRWRRAAIVNWWQDVYPETAWRLDVGSAESPLGRLLRWLRNDSVRRATLNVAVSLRMAEHLRAQVPNAAVEVIQNWADDHIAGTSAEVRRTLGLDPKFVVGYAGNLGRAHPAAGLLHAAKRLADDRRIHFLFSGGGAQVDAVELALGADGAHWTQLPYCPRSRLAGLLKAADVHVVLLDPRLEGLVYPSKFYGALSAGRAVLGLCDPAGELAGAIQELGCGWCVHPADATGIESLIRELAADTQAVAAGGRRGRAAFERHFSAPIALQQWERVVDRIAGTAGGSSDKTAEPA